MGRTTTEESALLVTPKGHMIQDITVGADAGTWLEDCWSGSSAVHSLLPFHSVLVGRIGSQPPATTDVLPVGLGNVGSPEVTGK